MIAVPAHQPLELSHVFVGTIKMAILVHYQNSELVAQVEEFGRRWVMRNAIRVHSYAFQLAQAPSP